jgi:hypothetical protein
MALGLTQPLTEMRISTLTWGQVRSVRKADIFTAVYELNVWKNVGTSRCHKPVTPRGLLQE